MTKLLSLIKYGLLSIILLPFYLLFFIYKLITSLFINIYYLFKSIFMIFYGKSIFKINEEIALNYLIELDNKLIDNKRKDALKYVESIKSVNFNPNQSER